MYEWSAKSLETTLHAFAIKVIDEYFSTDNQRSSRPIGNGTYEICTCTVYSTMYLKGHKYISCIL